MFKGKLIDLRKMRESDLDNFYELYHGDVARRGEFWPAGPNAFVSMPEVKKRFQEDGYWKPSEKLSILLIVDKSNKLVGFVAFHPSMYDAYEIAWIIFDPQDRGKGYATEATQLLVSYMFDGMKLNRIEAYIHPNNVASRHLAEKCGFEQESTLREVWYQHGKYQDLTMYVILRREFYTRVSQ